MTFSDNWNQPSEIEDPSWLYSRDMDRWYAVCGVYFDVREGDTKNDVMTRASKWVEEQRKTMEEINSWVDEELKDYPDNE